MAWINHTSTAWERAPRVIKTPDQSSQSSIISDATRSQTDFLIHSKFREDLSALELFREIYRLASSTSMEKDFQKRAKWSGKWWIPSPKDREEPHIHADTWNYDGWCIQNNRYSIEQWTLQILSEQIVNNRETYRNILEIIYHYFSKNDAEDVIYGWLNNQRILILGSHVPDYLLQRAEAWIKIGKNLINHNINPQFILTGSCSHIENNPHPLSEAKRIQQHIAQRIHTLKDEHFFLEEESRNTIENYQNIVAKGYLKTNESFIRITTPLHHRRAEMTENALFGVQGHSFSLPFESFENFIESKHLIHETLIELVKMIGEIRRIRQLQKKQLWIPQTSWNDKNPEGE